MNYHNYLPVDVLNGEGTRCVLFVSGCEHHCRGCFNRSTWSPNSGTLFTQALEDQIIADLQDKRIKRQGLSLSGGDPLHPENLSTVLKLVDRVKRECKNKDIWMWTGYTLNELSEDQQKVVNYVDVLIDGKFIQSQANPSLRWCGSANQVIHRFST
ncbi:anaerobic ribonucleoside-triphosphate reductase-activating protein [Vibrio sp. S4M6]|uniref:anaerobic ribonucleoside-triphosphate reductase-activating protein n=1 Tax=Vibrio sinus TaxID=2946865 RepID=UPI00202ABA08|nr:anaerobic ribonucleoside-triphosphate reductase-activating protein [Vibrio sinus]MCL9783185.1 anaerobic ribonucleoside-triphosphate reductase-activating protein [Vibrio sinus]